MASLLDDMKYKKHPQSEPLILFAPFFFGRFTTNPPVRPLYSPTYVPFYLILNRILLSWCQLLIFKDLNYRPTYSLRYFFYLNCYESIFITLAFKQNCLSESFTVWKIFHFHQTSGRLIYRCLDVKQKLLPCANRLWRWSAFKPTHSFTLTQKIKS
jgi:hypothetical protein